MIHPSSLSRPLSSNQLKVYFIINKIIGTKNRAHKMINLIKKLVSDFESLKIIHDLWMIDNLSLFGVIYFAEDICKYNESNFSDILLCYCKLLLSVHYPHLVYTLQ